MRKGYVYFISSAAALAGLLFGYDVGVISGAILFIQKTFTISEREVGFIVGNVSLGALIASALSGKLNDIFGRKKILLLAAFLFIIGSIICAIAPNPQWLIIGRFILGLAVGVGSYSAPLYIAEISNFNKRGALVTLNQLAITSGIFLSYIVNFAFASTGNWRMMLGLGVVPALFLGFFALFLPESPRWLSAKAKTEQANRILEDIHGKEQAKWEMSEIQKVLSREKLGFMEAVKSGFLRVLLLGIMVSIFTQAVGINAIIYYAPTIFQLTGFSKATTSILATMGIGAINVLFTIVAIYLLDLAGRRKLLLTGVAGIILSLIIISTAFEYTHSSITLAWLVLFSMALFVACQAFSTGPACWLIPSEIFPLRTRGLGVSLSVAFNWATNYAVAILFPIFLSQYGGTHTFRIFLVIALIAWLLFYFFVPETKGVSLEEIEANILSGVKLRNLGEPRKI